MQGKNASMDLIINYKDRENKMMNTIKERRNVNFNVNVMNEIVLLAAHSLGMLFKQPILFPLVWL